MASARVESERLEGSWRKALPKQVWTSTGFLKLTSLLGPLSHSFSSSVPCPQVLPSLQEWGTCQGVWKFESKSNTFPV